MESEHEKLMRIIDGHKWN